MPEAENGVASSVYLDMSYGIKIAVKHLCELGHHNIGFVNFFSPNNLYNLRGPAFLHSMKETVGELSPALKYGAPPYPGLTSDGMVYTGQLLREHPETPAIIATNQSIAVGCVSPARPKGTLYNISIISIE